MSSSEERSLRIMIENMSRNGATEKEIERAVRTNRMYPSQIDDGAQRPAKS
jgi:hypothetical protein